MTTTRSRFGRRLVAVVAGALTAGGFAVLAPAPAAHADSTVTSATLSWGFKESFRNYVGNQTAAQPPLGAAPVGERINTIAPATFDPANPAVATTAAEAKRPYKFPATYAGTVTSSTEITVPTTGGVTYNFPSHHFVVTLKNLKVVVSGTTAKIYADTKYVADEAFGDMPAGTIEETQVELATTSTVTADVQAKSATVTATNVTFTSAGAAAVPLYAAGDQLDDFTLVTNQADAPSVTVSQTEVPANGTTVVTVTGTGFKPSAALGTRPPLSGIPAGAYVVFGKFNPNWKPSAGAASGTRTTATAQAGGLKWAVPAGSVNTVGGPTQGAVVLSPDGTFTATLRISKSSIDAATAGTPTNTQYGIYTYPGSGAAAPSYETYTPITFSNAGTSVALDKASLAYDGPTGSPIPVGVTVTNAAVGGTGSGTVKLFSLSGDGTETELDSDTLTAGAATLEIPSSAVLATGTILVKYSGGTFPDATSATATYAFKVPSQVTFSSSTYSPLAGTTTPITVTVAKPATVAAPTGNVVVTYTPQGQSPITVGTVNLLAAANGVASFTLPALINGSSGTISASYAGNGNYTAAAATDATYTVVANAAAVTLDKESYTGTPGATIPVGVTVTGVEGQPKPQGGVTLRYDPAGDAPEVAADLGDLDADGKVTLDLPATLVAGTSGTVSATYNGNTLYATDVESAPYSVSKTAATVVLDKANYTGNAGSLVPVEVTVNGLAGQPKPTGAVTVTYTPTGQSATALPAATLVDGKVTVNLPADVPAGSGALSVAYAGDSSYNADTEAATYAIAKVAATVTLDKASYTGTAGTAVPVEVTVAGSAGTPTGSVVLTYTPTGGTATPLPAATLVAGKATVNLPNTIVAGTGAITVTYNGSGTYLTDTEAATYMLVKKSTAITVAGPATVAYRTAATYTATLTNGATGQVRITGAGVTYLRTIVNGKATFVLPATLPAGTRTLTFAYAGDANTNAATSAVKKVVLKKGGTSIAASITSKWSAKKAGKFTVTVKSIKGGPVPVGKVSLTLKKGSVTKTVAGKALANGKVVFTLPKSAAGTWSVRAAYVGSTQHLAIAKIWSVKVPAS